jgi:MoxR-like ATPase
LILTLSIHLVNDLAALANIFARIDSLITNKDDSMPTPIQCFLAEANSIILGKENSIKLALACILAKGHLLIEDIPGVGKTTMAHTLAKLLGLDFQRIQFTSDLLPADILGSSIFDRDNNSFEFHPGPVFSSFILADEINRATPKTQSALLEAMEERQVTIEKKTYLMTEPFFVIATQNPETQIGTFPLPESQLDRFLMRIALGYPDTASEKQLLMGNDTRSKLQAATATISPEQLNELQNNVQQVHVSDPLVEYVQNLLTFSRTSPLFTQGLSPRAGIALIQSAKAWALIDGRDSVYPEDIQAILASVTDHRLQLQQSNASGLSASSSLVTEVAIP